ncbi:MAG: hypothetical protein AB7H97_01535 [Pseudobdellovibrionaceae bacterium]
MEKKRKLTKKAAAILLAVAFISGCTQPDNKKDAEDRARMEGKAQAEADLETQIQQKDKIIQKTKNEARAAAEAEFQVQLANQDQLVAQARLEAKAAAEEELKTQLENQDQLIAKARLEAKASTEEELKTQLANQDQLVAKARAEGRAQAEEALNLENGSLERKAKAMEDDLTIRHRFYQAVRGTYEGVFKTENGNFNFRITLVPSLPPYPADRVRQLDEISADLANLYFNVQVIQWSSKDPLTSVGCRVENIRPDLINGAISIASNECPNLYILSISEESKQSAKEPRTPQELAKEIREGRLAAVSILAGEIRPTTNAAIYQVRAVRKGANK